MIAQVQPPEAAASAPTIVVTGARPGRCRARLADRSLTDRQLAAHAREWAALGTPVSVVHSPGAHYLCLARIAFRLQDRGVRLTHYVGMGERNEPPPR
jgi:hypothetical protein